MTATDSVTQAASLADAVLEAEAERQAAHEEKEVLFADDLLPGVGDEQLTLRRGPAPRAAPSRSSCCSLIVVRRELRGRHARRAGARTSGTASGSATG